MVTLDHVAGEPGRWTRAALVGRLAEYADLGADFDGAFDDPRRPWTAEENGTMTPTAAGEAGRGRSGVRNLRVHHQTYEGIPGTAFVTMVGVLRRMVAGLGGDEDLPD
ncbi:hypothetical protein [Streptomyces sp. NPDC048295]|uniref:hypothetical protein n=1 Tax=Streptomyces sp. NPDC048295 TaxID=3154617 RepID=UPI0034163F88